MSLSNLSSAGASRFPLHPPPASASGIAETSILSFKAGKMIATLKPNGKFLVKPECRLGELHVVWTSIPITRASTMLGELAISTVGEEGGGYVKIEWRDRRTKTTVSAIRVFPNEDALFERVETGRYGDRVYRLRCNDGACSSHFFWCACTVSCPSLALFLLSQSFFAHQNDMTQDAGQGRQ